MYDGNHQNPGKERPEFSSLLFQLPRQVACSKDVAIGDRQNVENVVPWLTRASASREMRYAEAPGCDVFARPSTLFSALSAPGM